MPPPPPQCTATWQCVRFFSRQSWLKLYLSTSGYHIRIWF